MELLHRAVHVIEFLLLMFFTVVGAAVVVYLLVLGFGYLLGLAASWMTQGLLL